MFSRFHQEDYFYRYFINFSRKVIFLQYIQQLQSKNLKLLNFQIQVNPFSLNKKLQTCAIEKLQKIFSDSTEK